MTTTTFTIYDEPVPNDREGFTLAEDDEHFYDLVPMVFNHRLVMTPKADTRLWFYGWCYDTALAATAAMKVWTPETQNEPLGWKKRPGRFLRTAPRTDEEPQHNRPRCIHGRYPDDGPCEKDPFCGVHDA